MLNVNLTNFSHFLMNMEFTTKEQLLHYEAFVLFMEIDLTYIKISDHDSKTLLVKKVAFRIILA